MLITSLEYQEQFGRDLAPTLIQGALVFVTNSGPRPKLQATKETVDVATDSRRSTRIFLALTQTALERIRKRRAPRANWN